MDINTIQQHTLYTWFIVDVVHFADGPIAALVYEEVASLVAVE